MERNKLLDICRGGAIFLVLLGHTIQWGHFICEFDFWDNYLYRAIYSFHMPLFMLISGYCFSFSFQKKSVKELIIQRIVPLLYVLFIFSILSLLFTGRIRFFNGQWFNESTEIWFLWTLVAITIPVAFIFKKIKNKWIRFLLLVLSVFFIMLFPNFQNSLYVYPYFLLGFLLSISEEKICKYKKLSWIFIPAFVVMLFFYKKKHFIYISGLIGKMYPVTEYISIDLFRWVIGLFGCIAFIVLISFLYKKFNIHFLSNFFSELGVYSLQIYLLQRIFIEFWYPKIMDKLLSLINLKINIIDKFEVFYDLYSFILALFFSFILLGLSKFLTNRFGKLLFFKN